MRIKKIKLSWFRGAAEQIELDTESKSIVVYGENGAGKSSFVDAIEYVLHSGRIKHLAHEYSGKHLERAVLNTHRPEEGTAGIGILFNNDEELKIAINVNGSSKFSGAETVGMPAWDYRRIVLRQDEVAEFIRNTKGEKYSVLLPLLGLQPIEFAAENSRQLTKSVEAQSKLAETKASLKMVAMRRKELFQEQPDEHIESTIQELHTAYCPEERDVHTALVMCERLDAALKARIAQYDTDKSKHLCFADASALDLKGHIQTVREASLKLADTVEPLIIEKLEILQSSGKFAYKLEGREEIECPACGRSIPVEAFQNHISTERERLSEIKKSFDERGAAIGTLCHTISTLKTCLNKTEVKPWRDEIESAPNPALLVCLTYLDGFNAETFRSACNEDELKHIEENLLPLCEAVAEIAKVIPADVQQLATDKTIVEAAKSVLQARTQAESATRTEQLVSCISFLEQIVRDEIRLQSQTIVDDISQDIQSMWAILHPAQPIEDVRLHCPEDAVKAIDIGLKFHSVPLDSPRLTLSEGYRNSLGLCIFLALAKREAAQDRPIFLDDVVVSLDRNHRGMIVSLLEKEFAGRQVILLTHDREWYTELRQLLNDKNWQFKALLPFANPEIGIRWSARVTTFDDARQHLEERPDSAGNDARKIMDIELALISERLQIKFPYIRGAKNDMRMANDFLERLIADGKKCFQLKGEKEYGIYSDAIEAFENARRLLIAWGNRASHSFDLVKAEAVKVIDACEQALDTFKCSQCSKNVWFADVSASESTQCHCGALRWRYGKG